MKLVKSLPHLWVWIGVGIFLALIFAIQIYLSLRQEYPAALSDEFTARSRDFVEQAKQSLETSNQQ